MSRSDIALQYKSIFNFRKNEKKHKKIIKWGALACFILIITTVAAAYSSKDTIDEYANLGISYTKISAIR